MALALMLIAWLALAPPAAAQESGRPYDPNAPHALAYGVRDSPAWLPRVLARLRASRGGTLVRFDHILFRRGGQPTFLALIWERESDDYRWEQHFELYRVTVRSPGNVRLHRVYRDADATFAFVQPTGDDAFGDGIPALFLDREQAVMYGTTLTVIRLHGAIEVVSPEGLQPVRVAYHLGRAGRVIQALDWRWNEASASTGCRLCGVVPVYFVWQRDRYVPACNRFPTEYENAADLGNGDIELFRDDPLGYVEEHAWAALEMAQAGRTVTAIRTLRDAFARARDFAPVMEGDDGPTMEGINYRRALAAWVAAAVGRALEAAHANRRRPCPLSQLADETVEQWRGSLHPELAPAAPR